MGHIGLCRNPRTHVAVEDHFKMQQDMRERDAIVLDPMLATGNSAVAAVDQRLDEHGYIVPGLGDAGDRLFGSR